MGNPVENPVGMGWEWEWELKFHSHGNPAEWSSAIGNYPISNCYTLIEVRIIEVALYISKLSL